MGQSAHPSDFVFRGDESHPVTFLATSLRRAFPLPASDDESTDNRFKALLMALNEVQSDKD